jgi:hypothetical protein
MFKEIMASLALRMARGEIAKNVEGKTDEEIATWMISLVEKGVTSIDPKTLAKAAKGLLRLIDSRLKKE